MAIFARPILRLLIAIAAAHQSSEPTSSIIQFSSNSQQQQNNTSQPISPRPGPFPTKKNPATFCPETLQQFIPASSSLQQQQKHLPVASLVLGAVISLRVAQRGQVIRSHPSVPPSPFGMSRNLKKKVVSLNW
ncbi:hypothetical protein KY285_031045 [Solanum tuberosum]|nr:hypothetical protein KY285_031045 [Solanum tuberosum]